MTEPELPRGAEAEVVTPLEKPPRWRPFQLAFVLLNLAGLVDKTEPDREIVGLAAFTIAHRRLSNSGVLGAGVTVVMRYTLRLLTLDQLSRARLALVLLLYTAQRRSDVVRLGRQHVRDGLLHLRQQKTRAELVIPVHPELAFVLEATPADNLTFLTTATGKPFSAPGFTNWFRGICNEAGLPKGTSAHGLRKAACRRLAEAGCSANVIASISGHATLREVQRYTAVADQARMARSAIDTMVAAFPSKGDIAFHVPNSVDLGYDHPIVHRAALPGYPSSA